MMRWWAYVGLVLFGVVPTIVKAVVIWRGRSAPMTDDERAKWDEAVKGP